MALGISRTFGFEPLVARSRTFRTAGPISAEDCARLIFVRAGSVLLHNELGVQQANVGDVITLGSNAMFGYEPEGFVTVTTICLDLDYVIDQVFWQHAAKFTDRLEARTFYELEYVKPAQLLRIGEHRTEMLAPWLDNLVALSLDGLSSDRFHRAQSLLSAILDVVFTYHNMKTDPVGAVRPARREALHVSGLLASDLSRRWLASELAEAVYLSESQLRRVFSEAFGKPPLAYLTTLRTLRMAQLLRDTAMPIAEISFTVGWSDPDFAARQFRRYVGRSPSEYRRFEQSRNSQPYPE